MLCYGGDATIVWHAGIQSVRKSASPQAIAATRSILHGETPDFIESVQLPAVSEIKSISQEARGEA